MSSNQNHRSTGALLLKLLIFTMVIPGSVTLWFPLFVLFPNIRRNSILWNVSTPLGVVLIAAGTAGYVWCALDFAFAGKGTPSPVDPPKDLVVRGLYKYTRNPMYAGVLSILAGESALFKSAALLEYTIVVAILFHLFVVLYEERALRRTMNGAYLQYCHQVPRWLVPIRRKRRTDAI